MVKCWAACLGNCSDKMSREHLVSASLFTGSNMVRVQGFPWCEETPTEIGLASLTGKILCKNHNSGLSSLDTSASKAFDALREMGRLSNIRKTMKPRIWNVKEYKIDRATLERWCLKTLINICYARDFPVGRDSTIPGRPSDRLVRIAYNVEPFERRARLYFVAQVGRPIRLEDSVGFGPLINKSRHVEGGIFTFRGITLLLFLEPEGPPEPLAGIVIAGMDLGGAQLNFHNKEIRAMGGKYVSHVLRIHW
jgi:hypothetical protein